MRVLDLPASAGTAELRQTYLDLVRVWHPDRFEEDPRLRAKAGRRLAEINDAYRLLVAEQRAHRSLPATAVSDAFTASTRPSTASHASTAAPASRAPWAGIAATAALLFGVACVALALILTSASAI